MPQLAQLIGPKHGKAISTIEFLDWVETKEYQPEDIGELIAIAESDKMYGPSIFAKETNQHIQDARHKLRRLANDFFADAT